MSFHDFQIPKNGISIRNVPGPVGYSEASSFDFHFNFMESIVCFVIFGSVVEEIVVFRCGRSLLECQGGISSILHLFSPPNLCLEI
jgi:hypothetical protein